MYNKLANATFRIECGRSSGSGFSFNDEKTILTNHHVIESHIASGASIAIFAVTEDGVRLRTKLRSYSPKNKYDFAILELLDILPPTRHILKPLEQADYTRGRKILFAGFPHGIHDLLVHEAIISGPKEEYAFYIDGSVNGGNSGGPIVDEETGCVIGIVTQKRFLGAASLHELGKPISDLSTHCEKIASQGSVGIMGVDFGQFARLTANGLGAISEALEANSNTGIGIGFKIRFASQSLLNANITETDSPNFNNVSRNSPCPCGSGKRFKSCCGSLDKL